MIWRYPLFWETSIYKPLCPIPLHWVSHAQSLLWETSRVPFIDPITPGVAPLWFWGHLMFPNHLRLKIWVQILLPRKFEEEVKPFKWGCWGSGRPDLSSHIRPGQHQKCTKRKRCLETERLLSRTQPASTMPTGESSYVVHKLCVNWKAKQIEAQVQWAK